MTLPIWNLTPRPAIHFVGFRGDEYNAARRVWGDPDFIHRVNDTRMRRETQPGDTVIYANGCEARPSRFNGQDLKEE